MGLCRGTLLRNYSMIWYKEVCWGRGRSEGPEKVEADRRSRATRAERRGTNEREKMGEDRKS